MLNALLGSINGGKFLTSCTTGGLLRRAQLCGVVYLLLIILVSPLSVYPASNFGLAMVMLKEKLRNLQPL
jgi:hypothetical protein